MNLTKGQKVRDKKTGRIYDYQSTGKDGWHFCYEEGECNMQDAVMFAPNRIELVEKVDYEKLVRELYKLMKEEAKLKKDMVYVNNRYNNWMGRVGDILNV